MADTSGQTAVGPLRVIQPEWDHSLIAASFAISFLGAFTSTQLICQAKTSRYTTGALAWTVLASLIFGFCSIWSLHFVATLACRLDLRIGLNIPLTILSAVLAVAFTFCALGGGLIRKSYRRARRKRAHSRKHTRMRSPSMSRRNSESETLLQRSYSTGSDRRRHVAKHNFSESNGDYVFPQLAVISPSPFGTQHVESPMGAAILSPTSQRPSLAPIQSDHFPGMEISNPSAPGQEVGVAVERDVDEEVGSDDESTIRRSSDASASERSSSFTGSNSTMSQLGMGKFLSIRSRRPARRPESNALIATAQAISEGFTVSNLAMAAIWSLALTGMHYVGIFALEIPNGYVVLNPPIVGLSWFIGFVVSIIACVLFADMEVNLSRQVLFSAVAAAGVGAKHFTGMLATTFYTISQPTVKRGYPAGLATAIATVAVITCIVANGLLAHSATVSRDKLAEVFRSRKKMWQAIAQKENAETAAQARSDFIASASHEIRTPLHQLQGYSDLLSRTELTDEGRLLLYAIQHATKTLSLITTNVLDWSRLEKNGDTRACQPVALDMRQVCEAVINLLPNKDEESEAETFVVVAPEVPQSVFLDETYLHRILMNLLSNATKFTSSGYILLLVEVKEGNLVASVRDTGCGIPPSFLPRLFDPFTQAETLGAHRGTGLGLSIIKQLLNKMDGDVAVNSQYEAAVGAQFSGSEFVATIPLASPSDVMPSATGSVFKIAIFHEGNERSLDGIRLAWSKYGTETVMVRDKSDIGTIRHIWIDITLLRRRPDLYGWLVHQRRLLVLVPYETQLALDYVFGMTSIPRHFITIRKPIVWHSILQAISLIEAGTRSSPEKAVRFAPEIAEVIDEHARDVIIPSTILLVEDNKINLRLMQKMLTTLKYSVIVAHDGQEAIDQTLKHDDTIAAILMDQSMPIKDGLTATREIRGLEQDGTLKSRHTIIAVTAVVSSESQSLSEAAGTDDFLAKPVSLVNLGKCLEKWVRQGT